MDVSSFPRWLRWAIPPLLAPLAGMAWIAIHWDGIPQVYATHFAADGVPDGWQTRTPLHVYGLPVFAEGLVVLLLGLMSIAWYGGQRWEAKSPLWKIPIALMYMLSLVFTGIGLATLGQLPLVPIVVMVPLCAIALIVYVARIQGQPDEPGDSTPDECWHIGGIYSNSGDPALFVPARFGYGYTLNMGNRRAYAFLGGLLLGIGGLVAFLLWSLLS
jgi:uncharacterized membrane protein